MWAPKGAFYVILPFYQSAWTTIDQHLSADRISCIGSTIHQHNSIDMQCNLQTSFHLINLFLFQSHNHLSCQLPNFSKNDTDLKKWYRSQKIIQISKDLKCKIKHTVVLKGHPPDLWRSPGLVSIRKEGTWISIRMLPWDIHSEELRSGQQLCA